MINLSMTFEKMKEKIRFREYILEETINPIDDPEKFSGFDGLEYLSLNGMTMADARVVSSKYLNNIIGWCGVGNSVRELNNNACMHGNKWNKDLDITLRFCFGDYGFAAQIIDSGEGFDYVKYCEDYKNGIKKKLNKGAGFTNFYYDRSDIVSFEGKGNIADYMFLVSENDMDIWHDRILVKNKKHFSFD